MKFLSPARSWGVTMVVVGVAQIVATHLSGAGHTSFPSSWLTLFRCQFCDWKSFVIASFAGFYKLYFAYYQFVLAHLWTDFQSFYFRVFRTLAQYDWVSLFTPPCLTIIEAGQTGLWQIFESLHLSLSLDWVPQVTHPSVGGRMVGCVWSTITTTLAIVATQLSDSGHTFPVRFPSSTVLLLMDEQVRPVSDLLCWSVCCSLESSTSLDRVTSETTVDKCPVSTLLKWRYACHLSVDPPVLMIIFTSRHTCWWHLTSCNWVCTRLTLYVCAQCSQFVDTGQWTY